ncbi:Calx-beta domain-containing protein [Shewanella gelidii]|uniref:Calx-beta domain-containing protein n=1 Tax=Shewanella gelidii TaxID=1642821 RepID=A0A917NBG4_9GAMM|nr:Calx-beta domain-containing protein [Shewanella gelidii]MCL1098672.1 hypothetical protein [Shewanella gelidii]GGI86186.1 hypothetical protein GCM10009332_24380 [Shewanella gelidii]
MFTSKQSPILRSILLFIGLIFFISIGLSACGGSDSEAPLTPPSQGSDGDDDNSGDDNSGDDNSGSTPGDDPGELPVLQVNAIQFEESDAAPMLTVTLSQASTTIVSVQYRMLNDTAIAMADYQPTEGTIVFEAAQLTSSIPILLIDDDLQEQEEQFIVEFYQASGALIDTPKTLITIAANDSFSFSERADFEPDWNSLGAFSSASSCGQCHEAASDSSGVLRYPMTQAGDDVSPYAGWQHSAMAHALDDPYYLAVVEEETLHFPHLKGTIEDKCLSCHAPMAHLNAHDNQTDLGQMDCGNSDGCYSMANAQQSMAAREGVSCTLCHQIDPQSLEPVLLENVQIDHDKRTIYGPYDDVLRGPMWNNTQYDVAGSEHVQQSQLCAVCHNLKSPSIDINNDQLLNTTFVEQAPFTEWLNSTFNDGDSDDIACQGCHMPELDDYQTPIAVMPSGESNSRWPIRDDYSQHQFLGGNSYLALLMQSYDTELGIDGATEPEGFADVMARNKAFIATKAASIEVDDLALENEQLRFSVHIHNHSGHKLPTGFPSRRVWLATQVTDAQGKVLFSSGVPNDKGWIAHDVYHASQACVLDVNIANNNADCYMAHVDVVTDASQVPIYESVMADSNHHVTYVLLHGVSYLKDNRIPPVGFDSQSVRYNQEVAIVGQASLDADFNRGDAKQGTGQDTVHYQIDLQETFSGALTVDVTLYYQSIKPAFVTGMTHQGELIKQFKWMVSQQPPMPEVMAVSHASLNF